MKLKDFLYRIMVHKAEWFPDTFYIKTIQALYGF